MPITRAAAEALFAAEGHGVYLDACERMLLVDAVNAWQNDPALYPLTCVDTTHRILVPVLDPDGVALRCPDCTYRQTYIPGIVAKLYREGASQMAERSPTVPLRMPLDFDETVTVLLGAPTPPKDTLRKPRAAIKRAKKRKRKRQPG